MNLNRDLDVTLLNKHEDYNQVKEKVACYIATISSIAKEHILEVFENVNIQNVKKMDLSQRRFRTIWLDIAVRFKRDITEEEFNTVGRLAEEVL